MIAALVVGIVLALVYEFLLPVNARTRRPYRRPDPDDYS